MGVSSSFEVHWNWKCGLKMPGTQPRRTAENQPSRIAARRGAAASRASQPSVLRVTSTHGAGKTLREVQPLGIQGGKANKYLIYLFE